jgi:hypothetical protein
MQKENHDRGLALEKQHAESARRAIEAAEVREAEALRMIENAKASEAALRASVNEHVAGLEKALRAAHAERERAAKSASESERVASIAIAEAQEVKRVAHERLRALQATVQVREARLTQAAELLAAANETARVAQQDRAEQQAAFDAERASLRAKAIERIRAADERAQLARLQRDSTEEQARAKEAAFAQEMFRASSSDSAKQQAAAAAQDAQLALEAHAGCLVAERESLRRELVSAEAYLAHVAGKADEAEGRATSLERRLIQKDDELKKALAREGDAQLTARHMEQAES